MLSATIDQLMKVSVAENSLGLLFSKERLWHCLATGQTFEEMNHVTTHQCYLYLLLGLIQTGRFAC